MCSVKKLHDLIASLGEEKIQYVVEMDFGGAAGAEYFDGWTLKTKG